MKIGIGVMCHYPDEAPEPEGTVFFEGMPKVGDKAMLSDDEEWIVVRVENDYCNSYPVHMERVRPYGTKTNTTDSDV